MHLTSFCAFMAVATQGLASPIAEPVRGLVARDKPTLIQAFADMGVAFARLESAFKNLNQGLLRPITDSQVPGQHEALMKLMEEEARYISRQNQPLSTSDATALTPGATKLVGQVTTYIRAVERVKPVAIRSGERPQVAAMLKQQHDAWVAWEAVQNKLLPSFQKGAGRGLSTAVTSQFQSAIRTFQS